MTSGSIAITRRPSKLGSGWLAIPVTRREDDADGVKLLKEIFQQFSTAVSQENAKNWIAVTSGYTFEVMARNHISIPERLQIACVGAATASHSPRPAHLVGPAPATATSLAQALAAKAPRHIVFPCSALAKDTLVTCLGADVVRRVNIYTSKSDPAGVRRLQEEQPAAIVVTSSSAARALAEYWQGQLPPLVAIGEPTAKTLHEHGITAAVARRPDRISIEECLGRIMQ